ncbi:MAG: cell division protein FtsZ [Chloroflexi bacterium]|nr:cell division protein FtsZ [Chloroflexota bacterium]
MSDQTPNTPLECEAPALKVVGMGGGGSNAVQRMIDLGLRGVEFIAANTDRQALQSNDAPVRVILGPQLTRGMGAGGDPEKGYKAAMESREELRQALTGADMVFLTAGMGGGTGTGSIAVAAQIAREAGAVVIAIVTMPFSFEGKRRYQNALHGLRALQPHANTLITIPNDRLLNASPQTTTLEQALCLGDDVLRQAVQGITELITAPGLINRGFADIQQLMKLGGGALMTIGYGEGEERAVKAVQQALNHPLLESISLEQARGVLANFTGGRSLPLYEVYAAMTGIQEHVCESCEVIWGVSNNDLMGDKVQAILVITGLGAPTLEELLPGAERIAETKPSGPQVFQTGPQAFPADSENERPLAIPLAREPLLAGAAGDLDMPAFLRRRYPSGGK